MKMKKRFCPAFRCPDGWSYGWWSWRVTLVAVKSKGHSVWVAGLLGFSNPDDQVTGQLDVDFCRAMLDAVFGDTTRVVHFFSAKVDLKPDALRD